MRLFVDIFDLLALCAVDLALRVQLKLKSPISWCPAEQHISGEEHMESIWDSGEAEWCESWSAPKAFQLDRMLTTEECSSILVPNIPGPHEARRWLQGCRTNFSRGDDYGFLYRSPAFYGFTGRTKKKKVQRKAKVPQCELSEDIVRYHWGAKTAKWADNATERKIIWLLIVGNSP